MNKGHMQPAKEIERLRRRDAFVALLNRAPGESSADRRRYCAKKLLLSDQTIRTYLMRSPTRFPTERSLVMLAAAIAKDTKNRRKHCK